MYSSTGIYTLSEAARLINVPSQTIHRWLYGYVYPLKSGEEGTRARSVPLWEPQLSKDDYDAKVIGFNDLLEIRFVAAFVSHGVPLVVVRKCLANARLLYRTEYPMSSGSFKTDGTTIFSEALIQSVKEGALLDLKTRQLAFKEVISPSLYAGIEYDGKLAKKWYPQTHEKQRYIVLDPRRQFGKPILEQAGVPTAILFASYKAEGSKPQAIECTARTFGVQARLVEAAIRYESSLKRSLQ
jgi:uncharacterized protein (DUF433 family)